MTNSLQGWLLAALAMLATAAQGGTLTGTVTHAATGQPIGAGLVRIYTSTGTSVGVAFPDNAGVYSYPALPNGTYFARTEGTNYFDELWNNLPCPKTVCTVTTGTPISIGAGISTANFALDRGGVIAGRLTAAGTGLAIADGLVRVYYSNGTSVGVAFPDNAGNYLFGGLPAGSYFVRTEGTGHFDELWDNKPCAQKNCTPTTGTPVVVAANATATANFVLDPGGAVAGTVTEAGTGLPIGDGTVRIYRSNGSYLGSAFPDNAGSYRYGGLEAGSYFALTSGTGYNDELWNDRPCLQGACTVTTGNPIAVIANATTTAHFALSAGGGIEGVLSEDGTGLPIRTGLVRIYTAAGTSLGSAFPDATGHYAYGGLAAGTYYVRTESTHYFDELYDGIACPQRVCTPTSGTPVTVNGSPVTVNFGLSAGGAIAGVVRVAGTLQPVATGLVRIYNASGTSLGVAFPDNAGAYRCGGLAAGSYYARTESTGKVDELWNDVPCPQTQCTPTAGTPIIVPASGTTAVDFVLAAGDVIFTSGFE